MDAKHSTMLAQLRKATRLSQQQVADSLGVSKATYSAWETGRAEMGAERIRAVASLFGCTPNDILGYADPGRSFALVSPDEEEHLRLLRLLPPNIAHDVLDIMRSTVKGWRMR